MKRLERELILFITNTEELEPRPLTKRRGGGPLPGPAEPHAALRLRGAGSAAGSPAALHGAGAPRPHLRAAACLRAARPPPS